MADQQQDRGAAALDVEVAHAEAEAAVCRIVAASGGQLVGQPLRPELIGPGERAAAGPGLVAARRLELAARLVTGGYIKAARAAGMSWHEIGAWLGLGPAAAEDGVSVAEATYRFATGSPLAGPPQEAGFWWNCPGCGQDITDRGPVTGGHPEDVEHGHGGGCAQLTAAVAAWDADGTQDS